MPAKRRIQNNHLKMVRNINTLKILKTLLQNEPISRIDISKMTDLSPTTVTSIIEKLIKNSWLHEADEGISNGGRKPIMLRINRNSRFILGVQITNKFVKGAIFNLEPKEVFRVEKKVARLGKAILDVLYEVVDGLMEYVKSGQLDVLALCISVPGAVNVKSGVLVYTTDLELENVRLKEILGKRYGIEVYVQNDANLEALAEKTYGIAKNENMMIYIKDLGGAGIIINGEIYLGFNGVAGELGHISIERNGERCKCGNYGCLYQYVSAMAIEANAIKAIKQGVNTELAQIIESDYNKITLDLIIETANRGDVFSRQLIKNAAEDLGIGIVSLVNILDIRFIVIGGAFTKAGDYFYQKVIDTFHTRTSKMSFKNIRIEKSGLNEDIGLFGCVCMVLDETFKIPF
jgi:Transcriptional regulator/sugar kinase